SFMSSSSRVRLSIAEICLRRRPMARVAPHPLTNGWSVWMALAKIRGVKAYVSEGQVYAYHRATGTRLKSRYGSLEFLAELKHIQDKHKAKPKQTKPGTWGGIVALYRVDHPDDAQATNPRRLRGRSELAEATRRHAVGRLDAGLRTQVAGLRRSN